MPIKYSNMGFTHTKYVSKVKVKDGIASASPWTAVIIFWLAFSGPYCDLLKN